MKMEYDIQQRVTFTQKDGVGYAYIDPLSGDSDIGLMHGVYIPENERGKGIGDAQHKERLKWMKDYSFSYALCTVSKWNEAEIHILEKNGWEKLKELEYSILWGKQLTEQKEPQA
jgi:RimJ/RimL family protein N-acetyltransferase